jgi:hypothetical protein
MILILFFVWYITFMIDHNFINDLLSPSGDFKNWRNFLDDIKTYGNDASGRNIEELTRLYNKHFELIDKSDADCLAEAKESEHSKINEKSLNIELKGLESARQQWYDKKQQALNEFQSTLLKGIMSGRFRCNDPLTIKCRSSLNKEIESQQNNNYLLAQDDNYSDYLILLDKDITAYTQAYNEILRYTSRINLLEKEIITATKNNNEVKRFNKKIVNGSIEDKFIEHCHKLKLKKGETINREILFRIMKTLGDYNGTLENFTSKVGSYSLGRALAKRNGYSKPQRNKENARPKK